jgi:hypothetical protein
MKTFSWLDVLAALSAECTPPGWTLQRDGMYHGGTMVSYHRYDGTIDRYVDVILDPQLQHPKVIVRITAEAREPVSDSCHDTNKTIICRPFRQENLQSLAQHIERAYKKVEQLNPINTN